MAHEDSIRRALVPALHAAPLIMRRRKRAHTYMHMHVYVWVCVCNACVYIDIYM